MHVFAWGPIIVYMEHPTACRKHGIVFRIPAIRDQQYTAARRVRERRQVSVECQISVPDVRTEVTRVERRVEQIAEARGHVRETAKAATQRQIHATVAAADAGEVECGARVKQAGGQEIAI